MSQVNDEEILLALRGVLLTVASLPAPADRVWDDTYSVIGGIKKPYQPKVGVPYLTEQFVPATSVLQTNTPRGLVLDTGLYVVTMFGITGEGGKAIRTVTNDIKVAFKIGTTMSTPSGNIVRVRTDQAPFAGQIIPLAEGGHSYSQVTVAYEVQWNQ